MKNNIDNEYILEWLSTIQTKQNENNVWEFSTKPIVGFVTNRLSNDGVAAVTELQSKALADDGWPKPLIITGDCTPLWSGTTKTQILPSLSIPSHMSLKFYNSNLNKSNHLQKEIIDEAQRISYEIQSICKKKGIELLIAQNTNSLPYNIPAALAIIDASHQLGLPVIHQAFDFFWQHDNDNRAIFKQLNATSQLKDLFIIIGTWNSHLWKFSVPNDGFRDLCIRKGFDPMRLFVTPTPIHLSPSNKDAENYIDQIPTKNINNFSLYETGKFRFGKMNQPQQIDLVVVFPSKLSRTKSIPLSIQNTINALSHWEKSSCSIRMIITGAPYDMENKIGYEELTVEFKKCLYDISLIYEKKKKSYLELVFLNGTPRFSSKNKPSMDMIFKMANLTVFGSKVETDCIGLYEACLADSMIWIRKWEKDHSIVFRSVIHGIVVGILDKNPRSTINPLDTEACKAINSINKDTIKKYHSPNAFLQSIQNINKKIQTDPKLEDIGSLITKVIYKRLRKEKRNSHLICIGGHSNCGKSSIAKSIIRAANKMGITAVRLSIDDFVAENHKQSPYAPLSPQRIQIKNLLNAIQNLFNQKSTIIPRYYHGSPLRGRVMLRPSDWIIIEGIYALNSDDFGADGGSFAEIIKKSSLNLWIETSEENRIKCFIKEDMARKNSPHWIAKRINNRYFEKMKSSQNAKDITVRIERPWILRGITQ